MQAVGASLPVVPAYVGWQIQGVIPNGDPRYGYLYDDPTTPCVLMASYLNAPASRDYDYTNARGRFDPTYGWGCTFDLVSVRGDGYVYLNDHFQNWILPNGACPAGFDWQDWSGAIAQPYGRCQQIDVAPALKQEACGIGNPINPGAGFKIQSESDAMVGGLSLARTYRSSDSGIAGGLLDSFDSFGARWSFSYRRAVVYVVSGYSDVASVAYALRPKGNAILFYSNAGLFSPDADITDTLTQLKDATGATTGWRYTVAADDSLELYNAAGQLQSITDRAGLTQTLTYSDGSAGPNGGYILDASGTATTSILPAGLMIRVTDASQRSLNFGYDANARIVQMTDPAGGQYHYAYDANNNLSSVTYPDGKTKTYLYNEPAYTFGANLPNALTGIIDENGSRYATYSYDISGRAISTGHANGADLYTLAYTTDVSGNPSTVVTDPLGTARTYNFQTILGVVKTTSLTQPCATCGGSSAATSYDANGNVASRTDFNGNITTYTHDPTRNLETSRTEASGTPQARTITTVWDSAFRLPDSITEPGRVTSYEIGRAHV